ncbi:AraC family transcriptional regulator [Paenibacillus tianjinensis]|uniref:Helix-turn-helix domain-containing protein n=1 Tax=Paenibacillus tianjinensis TaxID=2810347 RepID=A0ABX7LD92_9BACL|nr:AraC family transcriptional regulator [Paenibacillus tianjinensis]QSF44440.1 helix-turn-helix domain-containing protein [Paenibacillus tianjinensis]
MSLLQFSSPPLPHYIISGIMNYSQGFRHVNRHNIKVFDLLVVREGCLYVGEEDRTYEVRAGEALILRPDCHHYGTADCREDGSHYWLHFQTPGPWCSASCHAEAPRELDTTEESAHYNLYNARTFSFRLSQYMTLLQPARMEELLAQLELLKVNAHLDGIRFKQQMLFQEVLLQLSASVHRERPASQSTACAEQAASFLRAHYREEITTGMLGDCLNFHPVYIARCMNREYGCSPMEYLLRYRIEQSKLLLMQTSFPIARIAEEVGFNQAPYFSSSFMKLEGISPRQYRQRFS